MNNDTVISVENLSKRYLIGGPEKHNTLRDQIDDAIKHPFGIGKEKSTKQEFWALNDVSFEVKRGDVVGVIGRNGSGKSTLLKILSRIVEPTGGKVTLRGRVASLLEVGTGFNGDLTGRENVFLNGSILGMSQKEIASKFDEIVAFSGVEQFIDTPVKRYSSGMYVRLAFAVAAHLDSDILLVDEVLAVGDAEFQKKCLGKMKNLAEGGRTVLFVSHNSQAVKELCNGIIWLKNGVQNSNNIESVDVINDYLNLKQTQSSATFDFSNRTVRNFSSELMRLDKFTLTDIHRNPGNSYKQGDTVCFLLEFSSPANNDIHTCVTLRDALGNMTLQFSNLDNNKEFQVNNSKYKIEMSFDSSCLMPGSYSITLYLGDKYNKHDKIEDVTYLNILPVKHQYSRASIFQPSYWKFNKIKTEPAS